MIIDWSLDETNLDSQGCELREYAMNDDLSLIRVLREDDELSILGRVTQ